MKIKTLMVAAVAVAVSSYGIGAGAAIISDNFDGYANQAAFEAVWPVGAGTTGTLTSAQSFSAPNSIRNTAGGTHMNFQTVSASPATDLIATDDNPLVWSYMFYEDPANIVENANVLGRSYGQLLGRNAGGALTQVLAIGHWNANVPKASDGTMAALAETRLYYHARIAFSPGPNWVLLDHPAALRTPGWHEFKAVLGSTAIEFFIDGTSVWTSAHSTAEGNTGWYQARIGSGLSSATAVNFDDYRLAIIPEPTSFVLAGLGLLGFVVSFRRRSA